MFFPLFLLTSVILSLVGAASLSVIDQNRSTSNLMASNATFYAAESAIEDTQYRFKQNKTEATGANSLITSFHKERTTVSQWGGNMSTSDYDINIVDRGFTETPKRLSLVTEPKSFDEFRFINVQQSYDFASLEFYYGDPKTATPDDVIIDIIGFPRDYFADMDGDQNTAGEVDFGTVKSLSATKKMNADGSFSAKNEGDFLRNVQRMMYNSLRGETQNPFDGITVSQSTVGVKYKKKITIAHLDPKITDYIIRFQTIDKGKIPYEMKIGNGNAQVLPLTNQVLEVDVQTETSNMFQRVKSQQRSFAPLQPGLDFVLFSDNAISK